MSQRGIALYPACYMTIEAPTPTAGKTLFLLGGKDDWNAPEQCIDFASRVKSAGGDVTVRGSAECCAWLGWWQGRNDTRCQRVGVGNVTSSGTRRR